MTLDKLAAMTLDEICAGDPAAEQLAADTAAVTADADKILPTATNIAAQFGVTGTAAAGGGMGGGLGLGI